MRYALVRVAADAPDPAGLIGWFEVHGPRRYAIVDDRDRWADWVKRYAPEGLSSCGHVGEVFERAVRDAYAADGHWLHPRTGELLVPVGLKLRTDSDARLEVTTPDGKTWSSPVTRVSLGPGQGDAIVSPPLHQHRRHDGVASVLGAADAARNFTRS